MRRTASLPPPGGPLAPPSYRKVAVIFHPNLASDDDYSPPHRAARESVAYASEVTQAFPPKPLSLDSTAMLRSSCYQEE